LQATEATRRSGTAAYHPPSMPLLRADGSTPTRADRGRAGAVLNRLVARYPTIRTALGFETAWQLLVVTVLSAQTTDETVNRVSPALFARYPTPEDLAEARPEDVEEIVFSTGFYRQKAAAIIGLAGDLVERFGGVVPDDLERLVTLRGVGRKTASVVLAEAFAKPAIAVDTHVKRTTTRIGLTDQTDPIKIEQDLKALFPEHSWAGLSMRLIQFGRDVCDARAPRCSECEMVRLCDWPGKRV
jgi:endonuclease-3